MIIDFKTDPLTACHYDVFDAATGERVPLPIFYADDEAGVIRYYLKDEVRPGVSKIRGEAEERRPIRIGPRGRPWG